MCWNIPILTSRPFCKKCISFFMDPWWPGARKTSFLVGPSLFSFRMRTSRGPGMSFLHTCSSGTPNFTLFDETLVDTNLIYWQKSRYLAWNKHLCCKYFHCTVIKWYLHDERVSIMQLVTDMHKVNQVKFNENLSIISLPVNISWGPLWNLHPHPTQVSCFLKPTLWIKWDCLAKVLLKDGHQCNK